jgi:hypothetical protein
MQFAELPTGRRKSSRVSKIEHREPSLLSHNSTLGLFSLTYPGSPNSCAHVIAGNKKDN